MKKIDLIQIARDSIREALPAKDAVQEAYVAQPKQFRQVTEFLSEKSKNAHKELYEKYVSTLTRVSAELDSVELNGTNSQHSEFRSLKLDETYNHNATYLHELFFSNCFDVTSEVFLDSLAYSRFSRDFGDFEHWQQNFMACAHACGNGWAVTGYSTFLKRYVNVIISNHSQDAMIGLVPIVVLDMWEHSYSRDYLNDKTSYVIAMLKQLNWEVIEERIKKTEAIHEVLK